MCLTPINLKKTTAKQSIQNDYSMLQVPCGRCVECRRLRVNSWFVRLMSQMSCSDSAHFITITYDDDRLPFSDNGLMTLNYPDFQKYIKRLRKINKNEKKIKYFAVGEYGSRRHRPHYHAVIFNVDSLDNYVSQWHDGFVHVGKVQEASIYYTLKYALKSTFKPSADPDDDRKPEKALMSKGLGLNFLTPQMQKWYKDDVSRPIKMLGNKSLPLPRYYRDKLFSESEKSRRVVLLQDFQNERYEKISDPLYPQRAKLMTEKVYKKLQETD